jgi:hypothetical protein
MNFEISGSSVLPAPDRIELPDFSPNTIMLLQANNVEKALTAVLRESSIFYFFKYHSMSSSAHYQAIGQKLTRKYPCLQHEGPKPWVSVSYFLRETIYFTTFTRLHC